MKIKFPLVLALLFLTSNLAWAEPFKPLSIPIAGEIKMKTPMIRGEGKKGKTILHIESVMPTYLESRTVIISIDGKDYYQIKEKQTLLNEQILETTSLLEKGEHLKTFSYNYVRRSPDGDEIESRNLRFDDNSWNYSDDIYPFHMIPIICRSLVEQRIDEKGFQLWFNEMMIIPMKLKVMEKEQVHVPLGDFNCFKIKVESEVIMPAHYFWIGEKEPYPLIKYERPDLSGGPNIAMELIEDSNFQKVKR